MPDSGGAQHSIASRLPLPPCRLTPRCLPASLLRFVQFGQHNAAEEERAAAALCSHLGLDLAKLDVGLLGDQLRVLRVRAAGGTEGESSEGTESSGQLRVLRVSGKPLLLGGGG